MLKGQILSPGSGPNFDWLFRHLAYDGSAHFN